MTALYGLSLAVPIACFGWMFWRRLGSWSTQSALPQDSRWVRRLLRFSLWTTLAGLTWQILMYYPTWYLNKVHGHDAVAVFSAPRQIGQIVLIGAVAVVTVVTTTVTKTWESRGRDAARQQLSLAFRGTGLGLLVLCALLALSRDWIMRMFRPDYMPGADVLPLQLLFFLIGAYLAFLPIHFHLIEKTRLMFWPLAVGVAANVLFAFWLAGPGRPLLAGLSSWTRLTTPLSGWFVTGFSDPRGLDSAAWCGVFAIVTSLVLCILLIRAERARLDRGTYLIIASAGLLGMNSWILGVGIILVLALAFGTEVLFDRAERQLVLSHAIAPLRRIAAKSRGRTD
jgi:O-antigen/teichoic acid export membrane protein